MTIRPRNYFLALLLFTLPLIPVAGLAPGLAPAPAFAAAGSFEVLVDADGDPNTPSVRQFAGASRYETSLAAAQQYVDTARATGKPATTAIVASGEGLIDAAAAAGLARSANAPVLLTPPGQLSIPAAQLIERAGITAVIVVGGTAAVADKVFEALQSVPGVSSVKRVGGENRFDTAALIAAEMRLYAVPEAAAVPEATFCNNDKKAALLVVGDSGSLADATAAGPLAYAAGLPVLLVSAGKITSKTVSKTASEVPAETASALSNLDIKHVVVVGGETSFEDELSSLGVAEVTHLAGSNSAATSVAVLEKMKSCLGASLSDVSVALVSESALADGISAAPMLGQGLQQPGKTTPVLLVGSQTHPAEIKQYLLTTKAAIQITVIGDQDAVSNEVASAAVAAANGDSSRIPRVEDSYFSGNLDTCRLAGINHPINSEYFRDVDSDTTAGFPLPSWAASAVGTFKVAVLFIDFPDAQAPHSTQVEGSSSLQQAEQYLEAQSYGQLDVVFEPQHKWLRMQESWRSYRDYFPSFGGGTPLSVLDEAIPLATEITVSQYDALMIVAPSTHFSAGRTYVDRSGSQYSDPTQPLVLINAQFSGKPRAEPFDWWPVGAHELGHALGLTDLYIRPPLYGTLVSPMPVPGKGWAFKGFGLMGHGVYVLADADGATNAREMLAWSRWQLGWLTQGQVACLTEPTFDATVTLSPIATPTEVAPTEVAMIAIPVSETLGIVIEARQQVKGDSELDKEGVLIYRVNNTPDVLNNTVEVEGGRTISFSTAREPGLSYWAEDPAKPGQLDAHPVFAVGESTSGTLADGTRLEITVEATAGQSYVVRITRS